MRRALKWIDGLSFGLFVAYAFQQVASMVIPRPLLRREGVPLRLVVLIPALNEGQVISATLRNLLAMLPEAQIVVIDDDSDDDTAAQVAALPAPQVRCLRRQPPQARENKARAMNWAVRQLLRDGTLSGDLSRVVVVGLDADGRLNADFAAQVRGAFSDPRVMAAQGWMRYRQDVSSLRGYRAWLARTLLLQQDLENYVLGQTQYLRHRYGTPVLTGSGQCFRASYLAEQLAQDREPWPDVLLEDFAGTVAVRQAHSAYRVAFMDTVVEQQGTVDPLGMVRQRARWNQGTMECLAYLPAVSRLGWVTAADFVYLLLGPWMLITLVLSFGSQPLRRKVGYQGLPRPLAQTNAAVPLLIQTYWIVRYVRERRLPWWYVPYALLTTPLIGLANTASLPLAYYRYFSRQRGWYKSPRHSESPTPLPV